MFSIPLKPKSIIHPIRTADSLFSFITSRMTASMMEGRSSSPWKNIGNNIILSKIPIKSLIRRR